MDLLIFVTFSKGSTKKIQLVAVLIENMYTSKAAKEINYIED